jgi:hypothetical protein
MKINSKINYYDIELTNHLINCIENGNLELFKNTLDKNYTSNIDIVQIKTIINIYNLTGFKTVLKNYLLHKNILTEYSNIENCYNLHNYTLKSIWPIIGNEILDNLYILLDLLRDNTYSIDRLLFFCKKIVEIGSEFNDTCVNKVIEELSFKSQYKECVLFVDVLDKQYNINIKPIAYRLINNNLNFSNLLYVIQLGYNIDDIFTFENCYSYYNHTILTYYANNIVNKMNDKCFVNLDIDDTIAIYKKILEYGANPYIKNGNGKSAIDFFTRAINNTLPFTNPDKYRQLVNSGRKQLDYNKILENLIEFSTTYYDTTCLVKPAFK